MKGTNETEKSVPLRCRHAGLAIAGRTDKPPGIWKHSMAGRIFPKKYDKVFVRRVS